MTKFHDSHVHLDILLQKLALLDDVRNSLSLADLNLSPKKLSQIETKIQDLLQNHEFVLHSTVSFQNFKLVFELFKNIPKVKYLFGTHPELVNSQFDYKNYLNKQQEFIQNSLNPILKNQLEKTSKLQVLGIGECGLDYFYTQNKELIKIQKEIFENQIQLAITSNLPLIIHCREAFDDTLDIIKNYKEIQGKFLVHCFTGQKEILKQVLDLGGKVAFGGIITFAKSADYLRESLNYCPNDSWMLETDLPFLSPNRGQICLPDDIDLIAKKISKLKGLDKEIIWQISRKNFLELFNF